jgi:DNA-binding NarL/FixJ family response regulator
MSNRKIAAELGVSAKAVEYHLSNVYAKLGVHSRVQLATMHLSKDRGAPTA